MQLLQVGERDRAKLAGDIGQCGYALCCPLLADRFPSISIRMAKEQDVPLNPSKISGVCGRLLCCLAFEHEQYRELRGKLPKIGQMLSTPAGEAKLVAVHVLKQTVSLRMADTLNVVEMSMEELRGQYGTAVRPAELVKADRPSRRKRPRRKKLGQPGRRRRLARRRGRTTGRGAVAGVVAGEAAGMAGSPLLNRSNSRSPAAAVLDTSRRAWLHCSGMR